MKILNAYACLGGNRYKWGDKHEITAIELDPELARMYQERFPNDTVIVGDAHDYLLENYKEFDFIWSSPPCPTHSRARFWNAVSDNTATVPKYPDMKLYQEIILLHNWYKGLFCIENVTPYYKLLVPGQKRGRHIYWSNFKLPGKLSDRTVKISEGKDEVKKLCEFHDIDVYQYKGPQPKNKIARNLVDYEAGKTILDQAERIHLAKSQVQGVLNFEL